MVQKKEKCVKKNLNSRNQPNRLKDVSPSVTIKKHFSLPWVFSKLCVMEVCWGEFGLGLEFGMCRVGIGVNWVWIWGWKEFRARFRFRVGH